MRAWTVDPAAPGGLAASTRPRPEPGPHEVLVKMSVCGVCRTDLHIAAGDLPPRREGVVPGHEAVGVVEETGQGARRFAPGDRAGIAWLRWTCGACRFCTSGRENLCPSALFTGWDADGGYAEYAVVHEDWAYRLPEGFPDEAAAPLLCAGIIGYRALRKSALPPGGVLGIYGFGGSAHIAAQVALHERARVHVVTRSPAARELALALGAASAADGKAPPPEPFDSAIIFAPSGDLVPAALEALDRGGTLAIAGIHMSPIPPLDHSRHLFHEKTVIGVTANTRADGEELLGLAAAIPISTTTRAYPLDDAPAALADLAAGRLTGAAVLVV